MRTPSTDILSRGRKQWWKYRRGSGGGEDEEDPEEEPEEEDTSSSEEEEEADDDDEPDPWRPLRQKVGEDLKEIYLKEVQQFLDRGKSQRYAENAAFNAL